MGKVLQDIWILTENGITIFSRVFDSKVNDQLFGALMSALSSFAEEVSDGGLSSFQLSNKRFSILKTNNLMFCCSSDPKYKEQKALTELKNISDKFIELYSHELSDWDNDISIFEDFESKIEDSLEEVLKKFQKAFW